MAKRKIDHPGKKAPFPATFKPMLATLTNEAFNREGWTYEVKWDGYRVIAHVQQGKTTLRSRGAQNYTSRYPLISEALQGLKHEMVLDGEIVVLDENGQPDFNELQRYNGTQSLVYYVFDLMWLDGYLLTELPLTERKSLLEQIVPEGDVIRLSHHFEDGIALYEQASGLGLEGIIAKKRDSIYQPGKRANSWLKIKVNQRQEFVIGGWAESESNQPFKTLLFGYYEGGNLKYIHHGGGGFTYKQKQEFLKELKKIEIKKSPFVNKADIDTPVHWVKPIYVGEFEISNKQTRNGFIRHPAIFKGLRTDKKPEEVTRELTSEIPTDVLQANEPVAGIKKKEGKKKAPKQPTSEDSNWPEIEREKITSEDNFDIGGHVVTLTNVEKQLWKGVTKADLIQYYHAVAPVILPHLRDRPLSLHIKPISPTAPGLYIKDMEGRQPAWSDVFPVQRKHKKPGKRDVIDYLVCNHEATLLYLVNLGCIDINPWTSRITSPATPDYIVIDLDPSDDDFQKVITTALAAREVFHKHKITSFIKTSGKTGMHICLPCAGFTFTQARKIAEAICLEIQSIVPEVTTTAVTINQRADKVYIDPNQNDDADTIASAYSARPYHLPAVSTPLDWKEVKPSLNPHDFTIANIGKRIDKKGDLFQGVLDRTIAAKNSRLLTRFL